MERNQWREAEEHRMRVRVASRVTVGVTKGLVTPCSATAEETEQVYVFTTGDEVRPIMVEGWAGYTVFARLNLTKAQAAELAGLLVSAIVALP